MPEKISVDHLYKIFGGDAEETIGLLEQGRSKDEILQETGATVGVQDTSFAVEEGEIFVVMGLSGSGKSTLVRMLNRLIDPTRGAVYVDGEDITQMTAEELRQVRLNKMAMVFQHFALFPHKTVCENVEYGLKVQGVGAEERREKALRALAQVGLEAWADRPPASLSGGMQQRVGLARGLAVDPEIMLMDEPFSALDPLIRRDMQGELLQLQRHVARTIVFITHDLNEALILGDRIAIMKEGRFVQTGTPQDIVANPADDYVSAFTQDVDRGRVFTAATVMREPDTVDLAGDDAESALARMRALGRDSLFAVDGGEIAGVIRWRDLVDGGGEQGLRAVMRTDYPTTTADAHLYEIFGRCGSGLPLAVQDRKGAVTGVVYPTDVFDVLRVPEESGETARGA